MYCCARGVPRGATPASPRTSPPRRMTRRILCAATNVAAEETRLPARRRRHGRCWRRNSQRAKSAAPRRIFSFIGATVRFGAPEVSGVARTVGDANVVACGIVFFVSVCIERRRDRRSRSPREETRDESDEAMLFCVFVEKFLPCPLENECHLRAVPIVLEPRTERYSASTSPNWRAVRRGADRLPVRRRRVARARRELFPPRRSTRGGGRRRSARRRRVASSRSVFDAAAWLS